MVIDRSVLDGYTIAATMVPATEIGGDYYDLLVTPEAGWLAIGDVVRQDDDISIVVLRQDGLR